MSVTAPECEGDVSPFGISEREVEAISSRADPAWNEISVTPCLHAPKLSALTGTELYLKFENQQYTNSFKERGALAKLLSLSEEERARGVIAASAGNHAQGLARHAALLGVKACIFMPRRTPSVKVEETRALGADIVLEGDNYDAASKAAAARAGETGEIMVHPFDDPHVACGQGTVISEMLAAVPDLDVVVVPIGGGGLAAGTAVIGKRIKPDLKVVGVQAALYPSMLNALRKTDRPCGGSTLAEGIAVSEPGQLTRRIIAEYVDEIVTVEEAQLETALCLLLNTQKTLAEGAGAAGLAAVMAHRGLFRGKKVGSIICGGNIDTRLVSGVLMRDLARHRRLARLRIELIDVPGQLSIVSDAITRADGNIIDVAYHKIFNDLPAKQTYLDISVEATDADHMDRIIAELRSVGLNVDFANY
ncbi:threonine ammonia-lyase [Parvularcula marina]|uniref:Threonine ammonia-lyase n=1 Tax=Parvularcula marina TaxID=2292771 RepID=A0A371RKR2_9PROT|nr:threonine ammonia-lyase [Parvularcula marina]RFB06043.1 threonine ammonia-lyase [Parvularcula marina]